jgi:hypothetical protein
LFFYLFFYRVSDFISDFEYILVSPGDLKARGWFENNLSFHITSSGG